MNTYLIAECGSCHDGSLPKALALLEAAKLSGASAAKVQFWSDADALADRRRVPSHYREVYRRYQVPAEWLPALRARCDELEIDFMATAYLPQDVAVVAPHVAHFKVASFEANAPDLLYAHLRFLDADIIAKRQRLLFVSVGMGADVDLIVRAVRHGTRARHVRLLLCTSSYPAPRAALNLRRLRPCGDWTELDGFSDHSAPTDLWSGALAVAAGALVVERHLKLVTTDRQNPDAPHALTPRRFAAYQRHICEAEQALGDGRETLWPCESAMAAYRVKGDE